MSLDILVVEDEPDLSHLIRYNLEQSGHSVTTAFDGLRGLELALQKKFDMALLDIMMPKMNGLDLCRAIRSNQKTKDLPLIMITAKGEERDVIEGLQSGADDYMTKPFSPKILIARVESVLRRSQGTETGSPTEVITGHGVKMDLGRRTTTIDEKEVELTYTEFQILSLLMARSGRVLSRCQIVDLVRGENHAITDRAVDVQVVGLRRKLGQKSSLVETVRGVGYRFREISH